MGTYPRHDICNIFFFRNFSILFHSILFHSILGDERFHSILFRSILFHFRIFDLILSILFRSPLLQHFPNTQPQLNTFCPLTIGDPYVVNKICELVIGNSFAFAEYAWNMWKCESPMCICGKSEDNPYH